MERNNLTKAMKTFWRFEGHMGREGALGSWVLAAGLVIPLQSGDNWQQLKYSSIPGNHVSFTQKGLEIKVNSSSSPLVYPLKTAQIVKSVRVSGHFKGSFKLPLAAHQGDKKYDDFRLRIGMVIPGEKKLGFWKRQLAADWVKKLFALAPKNAGIDHIYFLNMVEDKKRVGEVRTHPLSELIKEEMAWTTPETSTFTFQKTFINPISIAAVWISIDGDQTKQNYQVHLSEIEFTK